MVTTLSLAGVVILILDIFTLASGLVGASEVMR